MTTIICHACQQEITEEVANSIDGWFFCSACLDKMDPDKRAMASKVKIDGTDNLADKTQPVKSKTLLWVALTATVIAVILIVFALTLLAELDIDLHKGQIEAPRLEDYDIDIENAGGFKVSVDGVHLSTTFRLMLPGTTVGTGLVTIIKDNKGTEARRLALYDQTYLIQGSYTITRGGVDFNSALGIKKGHSGDGVCYHNEKYWKYNTGYIFLDKLGSEDAWVTMGDGRNAILKGRGTWNANFMPISKAAKTTILKDGDAYRTYTWRDTKDSSKGLIYITLILLVTGAGAGLWFYRRNKDTTHELIQADDEINAEEN